MDSEELREEANRLVNAGRFVQARDAYWVLADAEEEAGHRVRAWSERTQARRLTALVWARRHLDPTFTLWSVVASFEARKTPVDRVARGRPLKEIRDFKILDSWGREILVRVGLHGRVTRLKRGGSR